MFSNFRVIAKLGSPIATVDNIILDSIISCALAKEELKDDFFDGGNKYGTKEEIDNWLGKILDKKYNVYCTSIGFGDYKEGVCNWSKRFDTENDDLIAFSGKVKQRIDIGGGYFKNYHSPLNIKSYKTMTFFVRGDLEKIKYLLNKHIHFIGKKGSQGYGEILEWVFEKIDEDISVLQNNKPMRPIPIHEIMDVLSADEINFNIQEHAIIPPYWRKDNREVCVVPYV